MRTLSGFATALALGVSLAAARAQMGPPPGPTFGGANARLFGDNTSFSATLEFQATPSPGADAMTIPGKLFVDQGKSRFEADMSKAMGSKMPPQAAAQMKAMGINMDTMVMISRPDKKVSYMVYPGMNCYAEVGMSDAEASAKPEQYKAETTELGKETVDGHPCVKNKVVVTDDQGQKHEATVWNATDLKSFPIKIEQAEQGSTTSMHFTDVKLGGVEAAQFDVPTSFTKYDNMGTMMQQEMMKRAMRGRGGP